MTVWLFVANMAAHIVYFTFLFSGLAVTVTRGTIQSPRRLISELRPFVLPSILVIYVVATYRHGFSYWTALNLGMGIVNWLLYKDKGDDDDRWKRRGRKVAEKVTQSGGRLVAVPVRGGGS